MERRAFSVCTFVRHQDRVLLIRHKRLGTWLPVGGEMSAGETPLEAARRELSEETGLSGCFTLARGVTGTPPGLIGYEEHQAGSKGLHMNFVFVADVDTDQVVANDEFHEHRWVRGADEVECPQNVRELLHMVLGTGSPLRALAERWLDAFNRRDLERLLALYAEDAIHTSPKLRARDPATLGQVRGKAALRAWWRDSMDRLPGLKYLPLHLTAEGDRVFMEYERHNPGEESYVVAEVLVVRDGLIAASHVYHG